MAQYVVDGAVSMIGYEQLTVSTTALGFTEAKYTKSNGAANVAVIRVSADIRYTLDNANTDLTLSASVGMTWASTDGDLVIPMDDLSKFRMIRIGGSDVTADCLYLSR